MAGAVSGMTRGTKLALGIVFLWFGGACLFIAFMSGKTSSLTIGTKADGSTQGPQDVSDVVTRLAANIQTNEQPVPTNINQATGQNNGEVLL